MKRTNKLLLTMGTAAAIVAPVASVVACGGRTESDKLKDQISGLYKRLSDLIAKRTSSGDDDTEMNALRTQIDELTHKLEGMGVEIKRNVITFKEVQADLSIVDADEAQLEVIRISNTLSKLSAAIQDATTLEEMKSYYPQYIRTKAELKKASDHRDYLKNPPAPTNKATEYKATDSSLKAFVDYFKPLFDGKSPITSFANFKGDNNNKIAEIGQLIGVHEKVDYDHPYELNGFSDTEGLASSHEKNGFGIQQFNKEKGMVPHIDIKYDKKDGEDEASIIEFFKNLKFSGNPLSAYINAGISSFMHAETLDSSNNLKLFPYVYTDQINPNYIHFAFFAYKTEVPKVVAPIGPKHYTDLRDFNTFRNEYNANQSIKRGVDRMSKAVGRNLSVKENYYTLDSDFPKIMKDIYYAPKADEMEFINNHISDADRISLYWSRYQVNDNNGKPKFNSDKSPAIGGFNVMASGRVYGIDPKDLYSTKDGSYNPSVKILGTAAEEVEDLNKGEVPHYKTQTLAAAQAAAQTFKDSEKFHQSGSYFEQRVPGRSMPSLAQNSLDWSTTMFYDLGGEIPFDRDASGKITGFKNADFNNDNDMREMADLRAAMWSMSNQSMGNEPKWYSGVTSWPRGGNERINPFLYGLDINYITVRNKDNINDLDLIFKASRGGKDLPIYKETIPNGAMNWNQINKAVEGNPIYEEKPHEDLTKDNFEFLMMKVMAKWVESGDSVGQYILPSVSKLLSTGLKTVLSLDEIDNYYDMLKDDTSVDLFRLNELVTNTDLDFMDVFLSEGEDSQSRKTLYTKYGENLLNVIAKICKQQILSNPEGADQNVIDSLSNEFEGL